MNDNSPSKILVVDDEYLIREIMVASLQDASHEILTASSGEEALEIFQKTPCDIVISDIMMSKISGIDLLFSLKKINPDVEVILMTGYASLETAQQAVEGGAYRYLKKPFQSLDEVSKIVEEALAVHKNKRAQKEQWKEAVYQRDHLKKRLGQLETMYLISHAIGFPDNIPLMLKEVTRLLGKVIPLSMMACMIKEENLMRIYMVLLSPIVEQDIENLALDWKKDLAENIQQKITVDKSLISDDKTIEGRIDKLVEIVFPQYTVLKGSIYLVLPKARILQSDEEELLEVTAAQIAGAIKKLQEFHKNERERLRIFLNGMNDGVLVLTEMGTISMVNQAAFDMLKCTKLEDIPSALKKMGMEDILQKVHGDMMLGDKVKLADGRIFSISSLPLSYPWELMSGIIFRDMTKQHFLQKELEKSSRLCSVGELLAGVVHEINTPLTVILGYSDLILAQEIPNALKHDLTIIYEEATRCQKMIQNLLNLARPKVFKKIAIELKDLIEKVLELKQFAFRKNNIEVIREYAEEHILVEVEPGQIQQVLLNIVNNAQDAMQTISHKKLYICLYKSHNKAHIEIQDNGPGISEEILEKIFDPFFTTKEIGKGSGLGLSISYSIINEHKGYIKVKNAEKQGAIFTIELPLYNEKDTTLGKSLIISSDKELIEALTKHLYLHNFSCKIAINEEMAIQSLQEEKYQVVFLDIIPSHLEKKETLFKILEMEYSKKCIMLYDESLPDNLQDFIEKECFHYLWKPISLADVEKLLKYILKQSIATKAL